LWVALVVAIAGCGESGDEDRKIACGHGTVLEGDRCQARIVCGEGTRLEDGQCVVDSDIECGTGTQLVSGACVPAETITCGEGTTLDGDECVPDGSGGALTCGEGTTLDGDECVADADITCGEGTTLDGDECVPLDDTITCGEGTTLSGGECVPEDGLTCGAGTMRSGDQCIATGSVTCGAGTMLVGNQCRPGSGSSTPTSSTFSFAIAEKGTTSIVYFLDSNRTAVHRYDLDSNQFLMPYSLAEQATTMGVSQNGDAVYLGSVGGRINWIDTANGNTSFLVAGPETILWLAVVDTFVYGIDGSGAWETHALYRRSNAERTFAAEWRNLSNGSAYAPNRRRIFTFRDGTSPNDIYFEDVTPATGQLSVDAESPYHGDYTMTHPIKVSLDESLVYVASGVVFDADDLTYVGSMGMTYVDLGFHGDRLYVLQAGAVGESQLIVLSSTYTIVDNITITGTPLRVFVHGDELTVFTRGSGSTIGTWTQDL
jgi:hypothetical protein